jgi:hypothetical protein
VRTILGSSLVAYSLAIAATLHSSELSAAPLRYQINLAPTRVSPSHFLYGASLQLNITWNADASPPRQLSSTATIWPVGDAIGLLTITDSADVDGSYETDFFRPEPFNWRTTNGDSLQFPPMRFRVGGDALVITLLRARMPDTFFNSIAPFVPRAFSSSEATWSAPNFTVFSGSATAVPEPATLAASCFGLLGLAVLRRHK